MKRAKKFLCILLALCMVLGMLPGTVFAANSTMPFTDVKDGDWFHDAVQYVYEKNMMNGTGDGTTFSPNTTTTRGMIVTILHRLEGTPAAAGNTFSDVPAEKYYTNAVAWASANNIVTGYDSGLFGPNDPITREQLAVILYRFAQYKGYGTAFSGDLSAFADAYAVSAYAAAAMKWAVGVGLLQGGSGNALLPTGNATRAQVATILMRFCNTVVSSATGNNVLSNLGNNGNSSSSANKYQVTFVLNDGSSGAYAVKIVEANSRVSKPENPQRNSYKFVGWYTEPNQINEYNFNQQVTQDIVLYAGWDSPESDSDGLYVSSSGGGTVYSITGIRMTGNAVEVTINANSMCALVVHFLDENTKSVLQTVSAQTPEYCELVPVSIPVNISSLPEHYLIQAVLLDENADELCNPFTCINYSSAYEEFSKLTIYDFEGQRVLNFDTDETNNFGVLNDEVKQISSSAFTNTISTSVQPVYPDDYDGTQNLEYITYYIFENVNEQVTALSVGDTVYIEGTQYLFKIGELETYSDGTVVMTASSDVQLTDFYDVIKVSLSVDLQNAVPAQTDTPQPMLEIIDVDGVWTQSVGGKIEKEFNEHLKVTGEVTGTGTVEIEIAYDAHLFSDDYFYCSIVSSSEIEIGVEVEASINNDDAVKAEFKLARVIIPTGIPGLNVYFAPTIPSEWEISASGSFNFNYKIKSGFKYDTYSGAQAIDQKEYSVNLNLRGKAKFTFGPKIALGIAFLEEVVKSEISAQMGIKISASTNEIGFEATNAESKHACTLCLDGEAKWFVEAKLKLSLKINDNLKWTPFDYTPLNLEGWINFCQLSPGKFYCSIINSEDSILGGHMHFDGGSCPNKTWRTTISTNAASGENILGNSITVKKQTGITAGTGNSTYNIYLYDGIYSAASTISGVSVSKGFVVNGAAQTITLAPNSADGKLSGKICDSNSDLPIANATIIVSQRDMIIATAVSNASGKYEIALPEGTYRVEITKSDYIPFSDYEAVENGRTTYLETALMVTGSSQQRGGFSGQITDAATGDPVSGVTLKLRSGWNNSSEGSIIKTLTTDADGMFCYDIVTVFGVVFGLQSGNYTLTATKNGYSTTSFNVVVLPGIVYANQNATISPVTAESEYRIVLTWGERPLDLDSHYNALTSNNNREHVYYASQIGITANLDVDDVTSYGPETITVTAFNELQDGFIYSVHDFTNCNSTNSTALSQSSATVKVYRGNTLLRTYHVPADRSGTVWNVFSIDKAGNIMDLNSFEYISNPGSVGDISASVNSISLLDLSETETSKD